MHAARPLGPPALLLLSALAGACGSAPPLPGPGDVARAQSRWPDASPDQLTAGRDLYIARCAGCHTLHAPSAFPPVAWPRLVLAMAPRAALAADGADLVRRYLVTMSELAHPAAPAPEGAEELPDAPDPG